MGPYFQQVVMLYYWNSDNVSTSDVLNTTLVKFLVQNIFAHPPQTGKQGLSILQINQICVF